ncbi:hypothetical protein BDU57DRAFT_521893 [Ampelomyces quisqualis]|uniref:LCCL domain-containing protein n=1 Tax=Ampelomyces quisqualis TaxID=50730 RepID=A0A6A5QF73_AMPQU|nr:hypothetical protein BDU57DRAFT_521893 [Ampelomyces quisqualis]
MMPNLSSAHRIHESNNINMGSIPGTASVDEEAQLLRVDGGRSEDSTLPSHQHVAKKTGLLALLRGPQTPKAHYIRPFFPVLQQNSAKLLASRGIDKRKFFAAVLSCWSIIFIMFLTVQLPIKDGEGQHVVNLDCTDTLWQRNNECGIDGVNCHPFSNRTFAFRCPAKCSGVRVLNPRHVGPIDVNYRPLVIGDQIYRGDSFMCGSAIHAGIISESGGCGRIRLVGAHQDFPSTSQHGIESIAFDSHFPLSYSISKDESFSCKSDPRSGLLLVSLLVTIILTVLSTSPLVFFPIFVLIFAHVSFVSDPPNASLRNITVLPDHISMFAKRLLPAFFVIVVIYRAVIRKTLAGLTAHFEKAFFWLGGFWIGALSNYTFDWIPISRLTAHDLQQQPGAKLALAIIILILLLVVIGQAYAFWLEGRLLRHLGLYGLFISAILLCLLIPGVNLRIHHYIIALLLLPGTSLQTRSSLLYQGILLGLFVNGVARWDFDSVLQTSEALRADAILNSIVPVGLSPVIDAGAEGLALTLTWARPPTLMDGISVLVNDVERSRIWLDERDFSEEIKEFRWTRSPDTHANEYFRWAYVKDGRTLDYSSAGILLSNGTWKSETRD